MSCIFAKHFSSFSFLPVPVRTQTGVLASFIIQLFHLKIKNNLSYVSVNTLGVVFFGEKISSGFG